MLRGTGTLLCPGDSLWSRFVLSETGLEEAGARLLGGGGEADLACWD